MPDKLQSLVQSRRFWAAVATLVAVVFKEAIQSKIGIQLSEEQVVAGVMVVVGWIVGDSLKKTGGE